MTIDSLAAFEARDVEAVVQNEAKLAMSRYQCQASPRAILLAGQPGAGKTELSSMLSSEMTGDIAFINRDDYRRYHPHRRQLYQKFGTDSVGMIFPFPNAVAEQLIAALARRVEVSDTVHWYGYVAAVIPPARTHDHVPSKSARLA